MPPGPISKPQPTPIPVAPPRPTTLEKKPEPPKPLPGTGYSPKPLPNADLNKLGKPADKFSLPAGSAPRILQDGLRTSVGFILQTLSASGISLSSHPEVVQAAVQAVISAMKEHVRETELRRFPVSANDKDMPLPANDNSLPHPVSREGKFFFTVSEKAEGHAAASGKAAGESPKEAKEALTRFVQTLRTASQGNSPQTQRNPDNTRFVQRNFVQQIRDALEVFESLPPEEQSALVKSLVSEGESVSVESFTKTILKQAASSSLRHEYQEYDDRPVLLQQVLQPIQVPETVQAPPRFQRVTGVIAVDHLLTRLPPAEAQTLKTLLQSVLKATEPVRTTLPASAPESAPVRVPVAFVAARIAEAVKLLFAVKQPDVKQAAIKAFVHASLDPREGMKKTALAVLKQLSQDTDVSREEFDKNYLRYLQALARSPRSTALVKSDAIRVILDLEQHQGRNREEIEKLIDKKGLVSTLNDLLKAKTVAEFVNGMMLLAKAWPYLETSVRVQFTDLALERAKISGSETLIKEVVRLVRTRKNDVEARQYNQLFENDLYRFTLTVEEEMASDILRPWNHYDKVA